MANVDKTINAILEQHNLFYAKAKDNTYILFIEEEDLDDYMHGSNFCTYSTQTVHRTGVKSKTDFLIYINYVDLDMVVCRIKQAKKREEKSKFKIVVKIKGDWEKQLFGFPTVEDRQAFIDDLEAEGDYEWIIGDPIEE
ncbi:hypothetical protein [Burkholderia cepacia]|uniref:hypothetical protein n=1 Tax=Burkholderia cepacia TaxID=292 RepID=UPI0015896BAA|nr:hypothetical protein [Burkholderia cepacia]